MNPRRRTAAAVLAALLTLGVVACEVEDGDPLENGIEDDGLEDTDQ